MRLLAEAAASLVNCRIGSLEIKELLAKAVAQG